MEFTNPNRKQLEAENRVRKLVRTIPHDAIEDFIGIMEQNLKSSGSPLSVHDILEEHRNKL